MRFRGWLLAVATFVLATTINFGLQRITANVAPFLPYFPALIATALYGGRGPGLLGLLLAAVASATFWLAPPDGLVHELPFAHWVALGSFLLAGALTVELAHRMRALRERAERLRIDQQADLEQHRATEAALRESETRLDLALRAAAMGTWELDVDSGQVRVSHRVREIFGADRSEAPDTFWLARVDAVDRAAVEAQFAAARRGESPSTPPTRSRCCCAPRARASRSRTTAPRRCASRRTRRRRSWCSTSGCRGWTGSRWRAACGARPGARGCGSSA